MEYFNEGNLKKKKKKAAYSCINLFYSFTVVLESEDVKNQNPNKLKHVCKARSSEYAV